jgi:lipopolysaccharide export system permease protein
MRVWKFLTAFLPVRDRYVLENYLYSYVICALSFIGIYVATETLSRIDKFLDAPDSLLWTLVQYYAVMIPVAYTYYLGPVLTLSGGMFALTLLNKNNELLPLKCSGMSLYRIVAPIFGMGFVFALGTFALQELVIPSMKDDILRVYAFSHKRIAKESLLLEDAAGTRFSVNCYWPFQKSGESIKVVFRASSPQLGRATISKIYVADVFEWEQNQSSLHGGTWVLKRDKDWVREYRYDDNEELLRAPDGKLWIEYERLTLQTDLIPEDFETEGGNSQYLSLAELSRQLERRHYASALLVKIHQHWAYPLTHVVLLLLGLPFVLNQNNRSVFLGVLVSCIICVLYYVVNAMCIELAGKGTLDPLVSAWLPVLLFAGLGTILFDNLKT